VQRLGKPGIPYHFYISAEGTIYHTSGLQTVTDHASARSQESIGVCFAGNFTSSTPTAAQIQAGGALCAWLLDSLHLSADAIAGLSEIMNASSPGRQWMSDQRWKDKLDAAIKAQLRAGDGDQSTVIASLRDKVRVLQAEVERLEEENLRDQTQSPSVETTDRLSDLVVSLQARIQELQTELSRKTLAAKSNGGDQLAHVADMGSRMREMDEEPGTVRGEASASSPIRQGSRTVDTIAGLQATIDRLQREIQELRIQLYGGAPLAGQRKIGRPPIQDSIGKLHTHQSKQYETRPRSDIKTLVIHHSAAPPRIGPEQIAAYHVNRLDWPGTGYHFLVAADGTIDQANSLEAVSYHAAKANPRAVGICFLGDFTQDIPPPPQLLAGAHLIAWLMQELNIDLDQVKGHKELMGTACPGIQWLEGKSWKQMLGQEIVRVQQQGGATPIPSPSTKSMDHYVLFWAQDGQWAREDWFNAHNYIAAFRPTVGFSADHAALAEYVTIVGGPLGVPESVANWLRGQGCKVDRIAGKDEADTKRQLDDLARMSKRFQGFDG
jgi:N-acetyl-anhydromuramyl-L-alanine amidase AmpD